MNTVAHAALNGLYETLNSDRDFIVVQDYSKLSLNSELLGRFDRLLVVKDVVHRYGPDHYHVVVAIDEEEATYDLTLADKDAQLDKFSTKPRPNRRVPLADPEAERKVAAYIWELL